MLNTKLNLYNAEWLDVVFSDRNKAYGAYDLRSHYGQNMVKAMGIGFTAIIAAAVFYGFSTGQVAGIIDMPTDTVTVVLRTIKIEKPEVLKPVEPVRHTPSAPARTAQLPTRVTSDEVPIDPPRNIDFNTVEVSSTTTTGPGTAPQVEAPGIDGSGKAAPDEIIHNVGGLEFMPQPDGGAAGWAKFLSRNLRFPSQAQDAGVGGRVLVSFVIEKDGHLSDLTIINKAGYGMDEEALRVLKLAKPWKPGMQNGQPVRVRYVIPMNFQLAEQ